MTSTIMWEDEFGEVIDRPDADLIEIRWFDTTAALDAAAGMPAIGAPPQKEGPADYPTAYFGTRAEALAWLAGG